MMIYHAHPIDQAGDNPMANTIVQATTQVLNTAQDVTVFNPASAWQAGQATAPDHRLQDVNMLALHNSDAMMVALPAGVPSLGVPVEMYAALERLRIPVVVYTDLITSWVLTWLLQQGDLRVVHHDTSNPARSADQLAAEFNRVLVGANR